MRFSRTNMLISSWPAAAFVKENRRQTAEFSITAFCWRNAGLKKSRTYTRHDAEIRPELFNLTLAVGPLFPRPPPCGEPECWCRPETSSRVEPHALGPGAAAAPTRPGGPSG